MKKLAAIFFLLIFLFNIGGYKIVFYFLQQDASTQMTAAIDRQQYDESKLITIRVPLSLPYQYDKAEFERVDGEITVNGKVYHYVQRKMEHGEIVLQCLPDANKTMLQTAKDDYSRLTNDLTGTNSGTKKSNPANLLSFKALSGDYDKMSEDKTSPRFVVPEKSLYNEVSAALTIKGLHTLPERPPQA